MLLKGSSAWFAALLLGSTLLSVTGCVQLPANVENELRAPKDGEASNYRLRHHRDSHQE